MWLVLTAHIIFTLIIIIINKESLLRSAGLDVLIMSGLDCSTMERCIDCS